MIHTQITAAGFLRPLSALALVATLLLMGYSLFADSGSAQGQSGGEATATPYLPESEDEEGASGAGCHSEAGMFTCDDRHDDTPTPTATNTPTPTATNTPTPTAGNEPTSTPTPTPTSTPTPRPGTTTSAPAVPAGLTGEAGDGTITLDWDSASGATGYEVQQWSGYSGAEGWRTLPFYESESSSQFDINFSGSSAVVSGLTNGICYSQRVRSVNSAGESAWTSWVDTCPAEPTPVPTPASEPSDMEQNPTISIIDGLAGVNSVLVKWSVDWGTATDRELTIEWEDATQSVSDSRSLSSSATKYEVTGLKTDTEYEFTVSLEYRIGGRDRTEDSSRTITTHSAPTLFVDQIDDLGVRSDELPLADFEWGVFLFVGFELEDLDSDAGSYEFAIDAPLRTGLEVAAGSVNWCTWPESEPDELTWHDGLYQVFFHVLKCGRGDGTTRMNIKARKLIGGEWEEITYYSVRVGKAWHQEDDTVKYRLGGALPTPTATPTGYSGDQGPSPMATVGPLPSDVPVAVATAVAAWNGATVDSMPTGVTFCEGSGCQNSDGFTVTINTRDWFEECGRTGIACVRHTGTTGYPYIGNQTLTIEDPPATSQSESEMWTND